MHENISPSNIQARNLMIFDSKNDLQPYSNLFLSKSNSLSSTEFATRINRARKEVLNSEMKTLSLETLSLNIPFKCQSYRNEQRDADGEIEFLMAPSFIKKVVIYLFEAYCKSVIREFFHELKKIIPFSTSDLSLIDFLSHKTGNMIAVSGFNVNMTWNQFKSLNVGSWLNDEMYNFNNVKKWTKRLQINILKVDKIFIPINISNVHWTLAIINLREQQFEYYDSLAGSPSILLIDALRNWVSDESEARGGKMENCNSWPCILHNNPSQNNSCDCGVFVCKYSDYSSENRECDFTQDDIPYFRKRMMIEIFFKKIQ